MSEGKKTLEEAEIVTERTMGRRSSMGVIGVSVAAAAGVVAAAPSEAEAQCTDSDGGRWADAAGRGRPPWRWMPHSWRSPSKEHPCQRRKDQRNYRLGRFCAW